MVATGLWSRPLHPMFTPRGAAGFTEDMRPLKVVSEILDHCSISPDSTGRRNTRLCC